MNFHDQQDQDPNLTWEPQPPGQERPCPPPTKTGTVPFRVPSTGELSSTYYALWGTLAPGKTPLICLHGGPGIVHDYLLPISLLSIDYTVPVLMYDQIGCGRSTHFRYRRDSATFWTPPLFMAELHNLIRTLGIGTYDLFGHSWGGMLAVQFVLTQPSGLNKLILSGTPSDMTAMSRVTSHLRSQMPPEVSSVFEACQRTRRSDSPDFHAATIAYYRRHLCRLPQFPSELLAALATMAEDPTVYNAMNGPTEFTVTGTLAGWTVIEELHAITERTVPGGILLVNGYWDEAQDECMMPYFTRTRARVKWAQFALSSHMPWLEETERFVKTVGAFLGKGEGSTTRRAGEGLGRALVIRDKSPVRTP